MPHSLASAIVLPMFIFVSSTFAQSPAPHGGGNVCPGSMSPQAAAAAGCRFIGSETGYDICANIGMQHLPQCAEVNQPSGGPTSHQIYVGVIMPTQNCEKANLSRPANWQYDCGTWCRSFGYYTSTPVQPPNYPAICAKYIHPPEPQQCSATDPEHCDCQAAHWPPLDAHALTHEQIVNMIDLWKQRIDQYWYVQFDRKHQLFHPAAVREVTRRPDIFGYRRQDRTFYYSPEMANGIYSSTGTFGLVIALAHEMGHNVQNIDQRFFTSQVERELDADRMAGAYFKYAELGGFVHRCDFGAALMAIRHGDDLPAFLHQAHGTSDERVHAFLEGYRHGPNADPF